MEEVYASKTSATLPTSIWCKHPRAELTSGASQHENLQSVIIKAVSSRMMRRMGHMECKGEFRNGYIILTVKVRRHNLADVGKHV
jgi:hypothetical protein